MLVAHNTSCAFYTISRSNRQQYSHCNSIPYIDNFRIDLPAVTLY